MSRRVRLSAGAVAALVAALLLWVFVAHPFDRDERPAPAASVPGATESPNVAPTQSVRARPAPGPGMPDRIRIPALEVDSPVVPIRAKNRVLDPPADPDVIGWWSEGVQPGSERGSALLTGHTIHTGDGALKDLETLADGDEISVRTDSGDLAYRVEEVEVLSKEQLAARAEDLFDQRSEGRLVVITCEDWDGQAWESNVVVTATPA